MQTLLPLIALPWLARVLEPETFGILLYYCLFPPIVAMIVDWGTSMLGTKFAAYSRNTPLQLKLIIEEVYSARLILIGIVSVFSILYYPFIPFEFKNIFPYLLAILAGIGRGINPLWFFQGINQYLIPVACLDIAGSLLTLILIFTFISTPTDWYLYLLFLGIIKCIIYGTIIIWIWRKYKPQIHYKKGIKIIYKSFPFFGSSLAQMICFNGTQIILASWLSAEAIGILAAVTKMLRAFTSLIQPFTQTIFPEACILASQNIKNSFHLLHWSFLLTFICSIGLTIIIWIFAPYIIYLALGESYLSSIPILKIIIWSAPVIVLNNVLSTQFLASWNLEKLQFLCIMTIALCSILFLIFMGKFFGLKEAAFLPIFTEAILFCLYTAIIYKYSRINN